MRVVCQQPNYLPWLGYFEQIARADAFVILDDVQWIRQGRQHRCRIPSFASSNSEKSWLTVPVHGHGHREKTFREIEIDRSQSWPRAHWQTIRSLYGRAPHFASQVEPLLRPFLEGAHKHRFLLDLCEAGLGLFWKPLGLAAEIWHSSDLELSSTKTERLLAICQALGATEYYAGLGSSRYLDQTLFREAGTRVRWQHFRSSPGPDPRRSCDYSVIDWLALESWESIRQKLGAGRGLCDQPVDSVPEALINRVMSEVPGTVH